MDIEIRFIKTPNVDRPEYGQYFETTEPYTGCGVINFYYDRSTNTSASEVDGTVQYGLGMSMLPKWQHPIMCLAIELELPWKVVFTLYVKVARKNPTVTGRGIKPHNKYDLSAVLQIVKYIIKNH